jgi:hypothetical protein
MRPSQHTNDTKTTHSQPRSLCASRHRVGLVPQGCSQDCINPINETIYP